MTAFAGLSAVVIDCADPSKLVEFYRRLTGWQITSSDDDSAYLSNGDTLQIGFQRIDGYLSSNWPGENAHLHLDFAVTDQEAAIKETLAAGGSKPEFQPGGTDWVVLTDPEGHPFCIAG
jgi:predicted enzyme related to lactoylglutathione lyase